MRKGGRRGGGGEETELLGYSQAGGLGGGQEEVGKSFLGWEQSSASWWLDTTESYSSIIARSEKSRFKQGWFLQEAPAEDSHFLPCCCHSLTWRHSTPFSPMPPLGLLLCLHLHPCAISCKDTRQVSEEVAQQLGALAPQA